MALNRNSITEDDAVRHLNYKPPRVRTVVSSGEIVVKNYQRYVTALLLVLMTCRMLSSPPVRHTHDIREHHVEESAHALIHHDHNHHSHAEHHGEAHAHHHGHEHEHEHEQDQQPSSEDALVLHPAAIEHVHLNWLGFGLTIPVNEGDDDEHNNQLLTLDIMLMGRAEVPVGASDAEQLLLFELLSHLQSRCVIAPVEWRDPPTEHPPLARLCDVARRARTGVLKT